MNVFMRALVLTTVLFGAATLPAFALSVRVGVPAGTVSVTYTTVTVFSNGNSVSGTTSYCPAGSQITVDMPDDTLNSSSYTAGFFTDAEGNNTNFDIDPNSFVDDGGDTGGGGEPLSWG